MLPIGISLVSSEDTIHLSQWLDTATKHRVLKGLRGLGMPPVDQAWAEGAGDGAVLQGERILMREITMQVSITGANRAEVEANYERLAAMLAPGVEPSLQITVPSGGTWATPVSRGGGGDYDFGASTDQRGIVTEILLRAGDPYWTATTPKIVPLAVGDTGRGLLPTLAELGLVSSFAGGSVEITNEGGAPAMPMWKLTGPVDRFKATSDEGDVLEWDGATDAVYGVLADGDGMILDTRDSTVLDTAGNNRFRGMTTAPRFWHLKRGTRTILIEAEGTDAGSKIELVYFPRAWVMF